MHPKSIIVLSIFSAASVFQPVHAATLLGPLPYLSSADSPFMKSGVNFDYFFLDSFEADRIVAPGVAVSGDEIRFNKFDDSVDADDGKIDGLGLGGRIWAWAEPGVTFRFDASQLGRLPTNVGIVWTDGINQIRFEAFGADGNSLGVLFGNHADNGHDSKTGEDRFYGAINRDGISKIIISNDMYAGIEVDHLQFGATTNPIPEPSTYAMMLAGLGVFAFLARRRMQQRDQALNPCP